MESNGKTAIVFGHSGMLGHEVVDALESNGWTVVTTDMNRTFTVDIGNNQEVSVFFEKAIEKYAKIDAVVNAAAFTNVDRCEDFEETAFKTNCLGAKYIAKNCIRHKVGMFVHVSTDYVYSHCWKSPLCVGYNIYQPENAYGITKLAGDFSIESAYKHAKSAKDGMDDVNYAIARTSRLFGKYRYSFVDFVCETCLSSINGMESPASPQPLVDMNITVPTSAKMVAEEIVKVCDGRLKPTGGYVNLVSECKTGDAPTVYGYAEEIYRILEELGLKPYKWFTKSDKMFYETYEVPRPDISMMATSVENAPYWKDALKDYIKEKYANEKAKTV